jgi:uncharacterized protein (DUF2141 family)
VGTACERHFEHDSSTESPYWFHHSIFARDFVYLKKCTHAVDMNHDLDLGGIEVIRNMAGIKREPWGWCDHQVQSKMFTAQWNGK